MLKHIKTLLQSRPLLSKILRHESDYELQHKIPRCIKAMQYPMAIYGGRHTVTMLPGGGIGPEMMEYVQQIYKVIGAPVDFEIIDIDPAAIDNVDLEYALISIRRNGAAIKGVFDTPLKDPSIKLRNVAIRTELDLYVYIMKCKSYPAIPSKHKNVDLVIIRQNTEGAYAMLEHSIRDTVNNSVVESLKIITRENSYRVALYAFEYARKHGRKKITTVHKANIMKLSDGLFLKTAQEVASDYPDIEHNDIIIDNCCMQLVANPHKFDVLLTMNLYGNIVAHVSCGITGGPGIVSGMNYGEQYAVFEPGTRAAAVTIKGMGVANPVAMLLASVDLLKHLGHGQHALKIEHAVYETLLVDKVHTPDLGGTATTTDFIKKVLEYF